VSDDLRALIVKLKMTTQNSDELWPGLIEKYVRAAIEAERKMEALGSRKVAEIAPPPPRPIPSKPFSKG
jgi:hypothetical protein